MEKNHGRLDALGCYVFDQLDCLHPPERWPGLKSFAIIASERILKGKTTLEHRYYMTSLLPDAVKLNYAVRQHCSVETSLHWCMDVVFPDDQMRARTDHAAHNLSVVRHFALNLIRCAPEKSARAASRSTVFALHLQSPTEKNSSVFYKLRAIALGVYKYRGDSQKSRPRSCVVDW